MAAWEPVAAERLEALRGGFDVGAGLQVSFGIDRAVLINGQLVVSTSLNIPDVSQITAAQANKLGLSARQCQRRGGECQQCRSRGGQQWSRR